MSESNIPFNIRILSITDDKLVGLKPVTSLASFDGLSKNFDEGGLYSISIFGRVGDERRSRRFSYIDIKVPILHPMIYRVISQMKRFYAEIMEGTAYAEWDKETKSFIKSDQLRGSTGYNFFISHWNELEFETTDSEDRLTNIKLIKDYRATALTSKIIVMPAGLRDVQIEDDSRISEDEINQLYRKLLSIANSIPKSAVEHSLDMLNGPRKSLQNTFNQIYDYIEAMLDGKKKLIMDKWVSRKVYNGTRNVFTSMQFKSENLNSKSNVSFNDTVVGLYQYIKSVLPVTKFNLRNGFLSKVFMGPSAPVNLVNKKTLKLETVQLKPYYYDSWMTDEGLEKVITQFGEETLRNRELEIEGRYVGLIYKGPGVFKLFQDIDELPEGFDRSLVTPVTFCELIYISVYHDSHKYPAFVTRYPIAGFGSIYISKIYLKPTLKSETRAPLGDDWQIDTTKPIAYEFPTKSDYVNSFSPHTSKLARLAGDFDGDTGSLNIVYSDEAIEEADKYLGSRRYYVGTDGKISFSCATDTVKYVLQNLTSNITT